MPLRKAVGYVICLIALLMVTGQVQAQVKPAALPQRGQGAGGEGPRHPEGYRDLLYVASPGNHGSQNGPGIMVFDVWDNFKFVKRIHTFDYPAWQDADATDEVKGFAISSVTGKAYLGTLTGLSCFDLITEKLLWREQVNGAGVDRMAISPDGKLLYVPGLARNGSAGWTVVDADTGKEIAKIATEDTRRAHNTIYGLDGKRVFLQAVGSRYITVADTKDHTIVQKVGPFLTDKELAYAKAEGGAGFGYTRPFTVNGKGTLLFVTVEGLLGFEVGDVTTGEVVAHVEVAGYPWTREQVHGEGFPSHGIALSPDEKEIWLPDNVHNVLHIFDNTVMPPKQMSAVTLPTRHAPGESEGLTYPYWVTMGLDGEYVYPSTGDVIDRKSRQIVATLTDEWGRPVRERNDIEMLWLNGKPICNTDQFGRGLVTGDSSTPSAPAGCRVPTSASHQEGN